MANKLRDIFNNEKEVMIGKITFSSKEDAERFTQVLNDIYQDGEPREVQGIKSLNMGYKDGECKYPIEESTAVEKVIVAPCEELIKLRIEGFPKVNAVQLKRIDLKDRIIVQNSETEAVMYKLVIYKGSNKIDLTFSTAINKANTIKDIYNSFYKARAFFEQLYPGMDNTPEAENTRNYLLSSLHYYYMLLHINEKLNLDITPLDLKDVIEEDLTLERIYYLICESKIIKEHRRVNHITCATIPEGDDNKPLSKGTILVASFVSEIECELFGKTINIHTLNVVFNAVVDKLMVDNDYNKVYFTESSDAPMYISTRGFLSKEEAISEGKHVFNRITEYKDANTIIELIQSSLKEL